MADFCLQCSLDMFNRDMKELAGCGDGSKLKPGYGWPVLCEGCGYILVDDYGVCISGCIKEHNKTPEWMNVFIKQVGAEFIVYDETQANEIGTVKTKQEAVSLCWRQAAKLQDEHNNGYL